MSLVPLDQFLGCVGYAVYVFMWSNGCVWLREIGPMEKNVKAVAKAAGLLLGVTVRSKLDSYTLSRTQAPGC